MKNLITKRILNKIDHFLSYEEYIELALYHPEKGYYMRNANKVGRDGDFYTSANVSPLFGELLGTFIGEQIRERELPPIIYELGAGTGQMAKAVIMGLEKTKPEILHHLRYWIVETSPYHQELIRQHLIEYPFVTIVSDLEQLPEEMEGIFFSNEFFDAFPVHVIEKVDNQLMEVGITIENGEWVEAFQPLIEGEVLAFLSDYAIQLVNGQRIEVPLAMLDAYRVLTEKIQCGIMITIDYGMDISELGFPERKRGSLRGYHRHRLIDNILAYPGEMDITSNVLFESLIGQGLTKGWQTSYYGRQDEFLLSNGILNQLEDDPSGNPFSEISKRNRAVKSFILESGISGYFRVLVQHK